MKKNMLVILKLMVLITVLSCSSSEGENKDLKLWKEIKKRTAKDLKKIGIKKVLLSNGGKWMWGLIRDVEFFPSGVMDTYMHGRLMYGRKWKIVDNELYFSLYLKPFKYYKMKVKAQGQTTYVGDNLASAKYCIDIIPAEKIPDKHKKLGFEFHGLINYKKGKK